MSLRERLLALADASVVVEFERNRMPELALAAARLALEDAARVAKAHRGPPVNARLIVSEEARQEIIAEQRGELIAAECIAAAIRALAEGLD